MPKWRFWERRPASDDLTAPRRTAPAGEILRPPSSPAPVVSDPNRLAALKQRREMLRFDVEQSELATQPENPWMSRINLLDEARRTVEAELALVEPLPLPARPPFSPTPVRIDEVRWEDPAIVAFMIGGVRFDYVSEVDWAERGAYVSRNELALESGDPARLLPGALPLDLVTETRDRLEEALYIFASDLRRRAERDEPLPERVTLDKIIDVCPECGDWRAWGGYCPTCTQLEQRRQTLRREIERLRTEAAGEAEERARLADRLSVAYRRLADADAEIARLESAR